VVELEEGFVVPADFLNEVGASGCPAPSIIEEKNLRREKKD